MAGNYFNVFVNDELQCILRASVNATCCEGGDILGGSGSVSNGCLNGSCVGAVVDELDVAQEYTIRVTKRTEPQMRGAMSTFKVLLEWCSLCARKRELIDLSV